MTVTFSKTGLVNATIRDEEGERVGTVSVRAENLLNEIMEMQEDARRYRAKYRPGDVNYVPDRGDYPTPPEPLAVHRDRLGGDEVTEYGMGDRVFRPIRAGKSEERLAAIEEAHARERDKLVPLMDMSRNFTNAAKLVLAVFDVAVEIAESKAQTVERARAMDKLREITGKR